MPWVRLCEVNEIPVGGKKRFKVEGREVLLVRLEAAFMQLTIGDLMRGVGSPTMGKFGAERGLCVAAMELCSA